MNWARWHLLLNHIPVTMVSFAFALQVFATWRKSEEMEKASAGFFVTIALLTIPAHSRGCPAKRTLGALSEGSRDIVARHEKPALISALAFSGLG